MRNPQAYVLVCGLLLLPDVPSGEELVDVSSVEVERLTALTPGLFLWLVNIRLGCMVFALGKGAVIEPYMSSRFARQLGYN